MFKISKNFVARHRSFPNIFLISLSVASEYERDITTSFDAFPFACSKARTKASAGLRFLMWIVFKILFVAMISTPFSKGWTSLSCCTTLYTYRSKEHGNHSFTQAIICNSILFVNMKILTNFSSVLSEHPPNRPALQTPEAPRSAVHPAPWSRIWPG